MSGSVTDVGPDASAPRERLTETATYHAYVMLERLARALPARAVGPAATMLGAAGHALLAGPRARVLANQSQVLGLPPDDALVRASTREAFRLYTRYWLDTFRLLDLTPEQVLDRMDAQGLDHIKEALASGKGAITALPHLGNWDAAGAWIAAEGIPVVAVAEELRPARLFDLFVRHRERLGMTIVALGREGGVGRRLARELADNRLVALVADRDLAGRGIEVEMFGRPRRLPAGPAMLSLTTGAPILVTPVWTTRRGWRISVEPPIDPAPTGDRRADVERLTRRVAARFEAAIASNPADWHLFQPGWDPDEDPPSTDPAGPG